MQMVLIKSSFQNFIFPFSNPQNLTLFIVLKQIDKRIQETEDEIQELSLDELKIPKITNEIKAKLGNSPLISSSYIVFIEKIEDLISLSLNKCELESLDNLPTSASLIRVITSIVL